MIIGSLSISAAIVFRKSKKYISAPKSVGKFSIQPTGAFITIEFTKIDQNNKYRVTFNPHTAVDSLKTYELTIPILTLEKLMIDYRKNILPREDDSKINKTKILEKLKEIGKTFYSLCFPEEVRKKLGSEEMKKIGTIRLVLESHLIKYPWELFHNTDNFIGLIYGIGRFVKVGKEVPNIPYPIIGEKKRVNFLIVGDPDDSSSAAKKEAEELYKFLKKIKNVETKPLIGSEKAYFGKIIGELESKKVKYDFIHITSHADSIVEEIVEEDNKEIIQKGIRLKETLLTAKDIEEMDPGYPPILVFINACESGQEEEWYDDRASGLASSFLKKGINFIGTMWYIKDIVGFWTAFSFYSEFLRGKPTGISLKRAKEAAFNEFKEKHLGWASYILYGDPNYTLKMESD